MSAPGQRSLTLIAPVVAESRFEAHRREAVERATLNLAAALTKRARDACSRAEALLTTGTDTDAAHRQIIVNGPQGALADLREARTLLEEVLREFD